MICIINAVTDKQEKKFGLNQYVEAMKYIAASHKSIVEEYESMGGDIWIFIKQEY